jgi:molybdenum cofactor cytidylyltransferase
MEHTQTEPLVRALGLASAARPPHVAVTGSGGKTALIFALANQLAVNYPRVWLTASTHLGLDQVTPLVHVRVGDGAQMEEGPTSGLVVFTGPQHGSRWQGLEPSDLDDLHQRALVRGIPLLIEADGARQRALKAHAAWEPPVPAWVDVLVVSAGLSAFGQPLDERSVHRPEIFGAAAGVPPGSRLNLAAVRTVLLDEQVGGLKNAPPEARRILVLNQADTPRLRYRASQLAPHLLQKYERVVVAALGRFPGAPLQVYPRLTGIVLAAGGAARIGLPKQLLPVGGVPVLLRVVQAALRAGLHPVRVVTGAYAAQVSQALAGLPVEIVHNAAWQDGQAGSLRCGLAGLPPDTGGAFFLPADQPFISPAVLHALRRAHAARAGRVYAPAVDGARTSPALFDQELFAPLSQLTGDRGGRFLFERFPPVLVPWKDARLPVDIDTLADYDQARRLSGGGG